MAFRLNPDGSIDVDSAADLREALKIQREMGQAMPVSAKPLSASMDVSTTLDRLREDVRRGLEEPLPHPSIQRRRLPDHTPQYQRLFADASTQQQAALKAVIAATPHGLTDVEFRMTLGLATNLQLRGLLIGVKRRANNMGIPGPIVTKMTRVNGGRQRTYRYTASPEFRHAMQQGGEKAAVSA